MLNEYDTYYGFFQNARVNISKSYFFPYQKNEHQYINAAKRLYIDIEQSFNFDKSFFSLYRSGFVVKLLAAKGIR